MVSKFVALSAIVLSCAPLVACSNLDLAPPEDMTAGNPKPTQQQSALTECISKGHSWVYTDGAIGFCAPPAKNTADGPAGK